MESSADSQQVRPLRGSIIIRSLTDEQRAGRCLTHLRAGEELQLRYEQMYMSRARLCGWTAAWCVLSVCGGLCSRLYWYSRQRAGEGTLSGSALLRECLIDAGLIMLSALPWLCCLWALVCLMSIGSAPCPMCPHCMWCLPCVWILPCIFYLWCVCVRKPATLSVLYHRCSLDGQRLTGSRDSLYHLYLNYLTLRIGRSNLVAIIDGVDDALAEKGRLQKEEPSLGKCCAEIFVFQCPGQEREAEAETEAEAEARRMSDYVSDYFSGSHCGGCWS
ncbi:uncharacterized protein LOC129715254 [Leucoraja erinacea]|uniref:uncharacterized protein LOC129715254 n=1 Tax=Leucoraja erinaceus TaxID=7782 RepID=UPI00245403DC|nr:uncharacterized protein LOC129715254 [Leucoraja erinacea]